MAPRANWRGFLKIAEVSLPVALYTAASTSERIAFHAINRKTGNRVQRRFVDGETGKPVERDDQVKGYETAPGSYIVLEPEEVAAAVPGSDKTLEISTFIACSDVDSVYFDKPYYLAPADAHAEEAYALVREGMKAKSVAALAQTVLFRRVRTVLIRPHGIGLVANTLSFDYEVRSAREAFADVPDITIQGEMLELAEHIINTKTGEFDPAQFEDRYENTLAELVKAKIEGRRIEPRKEARRENVVDLLAALRESAGLAGKGSPKKAASKATSKAASKKPAQTTRAAPRRKAG